MNGKILLMILSAALLGSCSTAYKTGQTPDDVYYSPARYTAEKNTARSEITRTDPEEIEIRMCAHDRRWRNFYDDYSYTSSPYYNYTCGCTNYSYYYNPYYNIWPVYTSMIVAVNTTPRKVNLNSYSAANYPMVSNSKSGSGIRWVTPPGRYSNSNRSGFNNIVRQVINATTGGNSGSPNNTRTYTPSSSGSTSSGSGSSSGKVSRPGRG